MPASPVGADFELSRERALGDLAVDGGPGQPGPGENGFQTDDTIWFSHGRAASCWPFLTAPETRREPFQARKSFFQIAALWRSDGGKQDGSNFDAPASAEAVSEGQFDTEPAA